MSKQQQMVVEFHDYIGARAPRDGITEGPLDIAYPGAVSRGHFLKEEARETAEALAADDLIGTIDGLCDLLYVVYGTAVSIGLNLDPFFEEVHRSNMTKTPNGNGKAIKGPNYSPPDLARVLRESGLPKAYLGEHK